VTKINFKNDLVNLSSITVYPSNLDNDSVVSVPGSKSLTNRLALIAAFAEGKTHLKGVLASDDTRWAFGALKELGFKIEQITADQYLIHGEAGEIPNKKANLYIGGAGTLARFLPGLLSASPTRGKWLLSGDATLQRRPQQLLLDCLRSMSAEIHCVLEQGFLPIEILGNSFFGGSASIDGSISSQYISGLLMAAPLTKLGLQISAPGHLVQKEYITMTETIMQHFGVSVEKIGATWSVNRGLYKGCDVTVDADVSSAAYLFALAAAHGRTLTVSQLMPFNQQPDIQILSALKKMGCEVIEKNGSTQITGPTQLKGGFTFDLTEYSDQAMTLGALAALCDGPIELTGIGHIRFHESDRILSLHHNLSNVGIHSDLTSDGIIIYPGDLMPGTIDPRSDHRCAMSFAVLASRSKEMKILNPSCVGKTFPDFFQIIESIGINLLGSQP
jgi:3-phosphoshikimate 1-carboxyvinyltransferase